MRHCVLELCLLASTMHGLMVYLTPGWADAQMPHLVQGKDHALRDTGSVCTAVSTRDPGKNPRAACGLLKSQGRHGGGQLPLHLTVGAGRPDKAGGYA